ncbi:MAG: endonuclease III domain-containing protein [Gemmatimonadota bacterium]
MAERLRAVLELGPRPRRDPVDELVLTILSQSTSDGNRDRAWRALRARYPSWEDAEASPAPELESVIRPAGLAGQKAAAILAALRRLRSERGRITLDHLDGMTDDEAMAYLASFRGVGRKTAACVLCFSLGRDVLPVDTHVHRIARRLGWVPEAAGATRAHDRLAAIVPPALRAELHFLLIAHGRNTCRSRRPDCLRCPLNDGCPRVGADEDG